LVDVREEIDRIDGGIVALLSERAAFVKRAARFKTTDAEVAAPQRVSRMLEQRRQWALAAKLSPDFVEALFRSMVEYFVTQEHSELRREREGDDDTESGSRVP
jgi:isochorismate pyruvate lyase